MLTSSQMSNYAKNTFEHQPHNFRLDRAIALLRRKDLIVVAGTGRGKTLSFVMPCFISRNVRVMIILPLNAFRDEQVSFLFADITYFADQCQFQVYRFRLWGLTVATVNAASLRDTSPGKSSSVKSGLERRRYCSVGQPEGGYHCRITTITVKSE
jgi:hypothetical protein